jgi:nucleoside-diphosphate-sugar epimerase
LTENLPVKPEDTYEHTKAQGESLLRMYQERYSLDARVVRFPFLYGPKQYVVWPLNIVLYHALNAKRLELRQGGDYGLEYLFVKDAAMGTILALKAKGARSGTYNIGTGKTTSTLEVAKVVKDLYPSFEYKIGPGLWPSGMLNAWIRGPLNIGKAEKELGYRPKYGIEDGLRELGEWERRHPDEYQAWPKNDLWIM